MIKEIIPTIFAQDIETFEKKVKILSFADSFHLDFMDGKFTNSSPSISFEDMNLLKKNSNKKLEVHLMTYNPVQYLNQIKNLNIKKVLIQYEAFNNCRDLLEEKNKFKAENLSVFLVINPKTEISQVKEILAEFDGVMLMSVIPGAEGQAFIETTYDKIKEIRKFDENIIIQIDGGVKENNAKKLFEVGANILSVGSFISSAENPKENYEKLIHTRIS